MQISIQSDILSVSDAAKEIGVSRSWLHMMIKSDKIFSIEFKGIYFIPISEVERLKKERREK
jgi:hypothetical protein